MYLRTRQQPRAQSILSDPQRVLLQRLGVCGVCLGQHPTEALETCELLAQQAAVGVLDVQRGVSVRLGGVGGE